MAIQRRETRRFLLTLVSTAIFLCAGPVVMAQQTPETSQIDPAGAESALDEQRVVLGIDGGIGRFTESTIDQESELWFVGTVFRWNPDLRSELFAAFDFAMQERQYTQVGIGSAGVAPRVIEDEMQLDSIIAYGYDVLHIFDVNWLFYAGWHHLAVLNDRFDHHLTGGVVGTRFEWPISTMFSVDLFVDHTLNLLNLADETTASNADSSTGDIVGSLNFGVGLQIFASDMVQLGLAYDGEQLAYDFTDLIVHRLAIEFAVHLWI